MPDLRTIRREEVEPDETCQRKLCGLSRHRIGARCLRRRALLGRCNAKRILGIRPTAATGKRQHSDGR